MEALLKALAQSQLFVFYKKAFCCWSIIACFTEGKCPVQLTQQSATNKQFLLKKTLIIFDIDGTLVFSNKVDSQCFAETYDKVYGRPFPSIDWRRYPHVTDHAIFHSVIREQFGRPCEPGEIEAFQNHFVELLEQKRKEQPEGFREVPGARETVLRLLGHPDYAVGIGTGGWHRPACLKLNHVNIPLENIYLSAADGKETRKAIIEEAVHFSKQKHRSFERIVYVGDAVWDVRTTRNMSMNFVGIRKDGDVDVLRREGAAVVLEDFSDHDAFLRAVQTAVPPKKNQERGTI